MAIRQEAQVRPAASSRPAPSTTVDNDFNVGVNFMALSTPEVMRAIRAAHERTIVGPVDHLVRQDVV